MKLKARDSFYSSETKQVHAGQEFEVESETRAKEFVDKGLASAIDHPDAKKAEEPKNKAAPEPQNKAAAPGETKPNKGEK